MADDFDVILQDVRVNVNTAVRRAAVEIGGEIQNAYEASITKFYASYSPKRYERTYSLFEGAKGVGGYGVNYRQLGKNMYECGVNVGPENYSGNPYVKSPPHGMDMDPSIVFPRAWDKGIHGFIPYDITKNHREHSGGKSDYNYWRIKRSSVPPKSNPPKQKMEVEFAKINNEAHCKGVIEKYIGSLGGF